MFKRLLIANRGEIACRIIRTAKKLGITCIAVYSEADVEAQHVKQADEAYCIGQAPSQDSYLNINKLIKLAKQQQVDAIHPGYGFLSENADFATACAKAGIIFVGPSAKAIELMGNKNQAKRLLAAANIPFLPSYYGQAQDQASLQKAAEQIAYPVLLKAAAGGGGKGMRVVRQASEFATQLAAAKREALNSFGNDEILIEKFLTTPRHIEVQIFADRQGNIVHLWDRDCSIQRRYQKVIEEAPAPNIPALVREQLHLTAIKAVKAIDYVGAGTIEFLLDEHHAFYFMEMNTRLQVEHPVTEMITGYDLVEWQLNIAAGEPLPVTQADIKIQGHAIETRICAENPQQDFLPSSGKIHFLQFPTATATTRIDSGIVAGDTIPSYYDSLLAKLIVHGACREQAITRLTQALKDCHIVGIHTNLPLLKKLVRLNDFTQGSGYTHLIARHQTQLLTSVKVIQPSAWLAISLFILLEQQQNVIKQAQLHTAAYSPWHATDGWRLNTQPYSQTIELQTGQQQCALQIIYSVSGYIIKLQGKSYQVKGYLDVEQQLRCLIDGELVTYKIIRVKNRFHLIDVTDTLIFEPSLVKPSAIASVESSLLAQLPGTLVALFVQPGDVVKQGAPLLAIEAMKMEHLLRAPYAGKIATIYYQIGEQVTEGAKLINLTELTDETLPPKSV